MRKLTLFATILSGALLTGVAVAAPPPDQIGIVSATYQEASGKRIVDVAEKVADLCGGHSRYCQFYCASSTFGDNRLHHKKICRVTYRCGDEVTRVTEGEENDPVTLRCAAPAHDN